MSTKRSNSWWVALFWLLAVVAVLGVYYWQTNRANPRGQAGGTAAGTEDKFEKLVRAAALLENVRYDQAMELYDEFQGQDRSVGVLKNRAIASLANVKYNIDLAQDPKNDIERLRTKLPTLFEISSSAIAEYMRVAPNDPIGCQLSVLRDVRWIAVLAAANPIIADEEQSNLLKNLRSLSKVFLATLFLPLNTTTQPRR